MNVSQGTLATVGAAQKVGGEVAVLVVGSGVQDVAQNAAKIAGVSKVLTVDNEVISENPIRSANSSSSDCLFVCSCWHTQWQRQWPRSLGLWLAAIHTSWLLQAMKAKTSSHALLLL